MSYDHGSIDLGISNPFKFEGLIKLGRGVVTSMLAIYLLMKVPGLVKTSPLHAWTFVGVGVPLLAYGLAVFGIGTMQVLRFFVGRSAPTSLAENINPSEVNAAYEPYHYSAQQLDMMMDGQKNPTFTEPDGLIARLVHSLFPKLTFLPYAVRNLAQRLALAVLKTVIALGCFSVTWFISSTGLIGDAGEFVIHIFSLVLLVYLWRVWRSTGARISTQKAQMLEGYSPKKLAGVIALSIIVPVVIGLAYNAFVAPGLEKSKLSSEQLLALLEHFTVSSLLGMLFLLVVASCVMLVVLVAVRAKMTNPLTEVSAERGKNWQKDVNGAKEIFHQVKNGVLVNRRQLEVPNRIYRSAYEENGETRGEFVFSIIEETQPVYEVVHYPKIFQMMRVGATIFGQLLLLVASVMWTLLAEKIITLREFYVVAKGGGLSGASSMFDAVGGVWILFLAILIVMTFGRLLSNMSHFFWGEVCFQSALYFFKAEGTFVHNTVTAGKAVHDSNQSEGEVTRISVNPAVMVARAISVTYAGVGAKNLEYPRFILEMHKDEGELQSVINELDAFFDSRSTVEGITNRDMAKQVHSQGAYVERMGNITQGSVRLTDDLTEMLPPAGDLGEEPA